MQTAWTPAVMLDLETASAKALEESIAKFNQHFHDQPVPPLSLQSGWHRIDQQLAENLLRRNRGNRKVSLATVLKYAQRMLADDWRKTGQPILINIMGQLEDAQHRLWACYFSGQSFDSYIVADVPIQDDLFAYLDDGKPRSAADALYTSGNNGQSPSIAAAIRIAWRYDHEALRVIKQPSIRAMTNMESLDYGRKHPGINRAAHVLAGTYGRASQVIGSKGIAVFVAWKILEIYGSDVLDEFLVPLGSGANLDEGNPILALRNRLLMESEEKLKVAQKLALVIKGFNLHRASAVVGRRGLFVRDNEKFPRFEEQTSLTKAA
jgi:hypothetical protein